MLDRCTYINFPTYIAVSIEVTSSEKEDSVCVHGYKKKLNSWNST